MKRTIEGLPGSGLVLRIGRLYKPGMDDTEVYDAVRGWWKLDADKRESVGYVLAVAGGIIRGVYRVEAWVPRRRGDRGWEQDANGAPKWGFDGRPAAGLEHLLGRDVSHLFPRGSANPVTHVDGS